MHTLSLETNAPDFYVSMLSGDLLSLHDALQEAPALVVFGRPEIHSSRLVVGYARRLVAQVPKLKLFLVFQGEAGAIERYAKDYLDPQTVLHDASLAVSRKFGVTHVPTVYYLETPQAVIKAAFTGFSRPGLNRIADLAAAALGEKPKELITVADNKGEYELAERALS